MYLKLDSWEMDLQAVRNGTRLASFLVEPNFDCITITEPESDKDTCSITRLVHIDLQRRCYRAICANLEDAGDYLKLLGYLDSQMYNVEKSTLSCTVAVTCLHWQRHRLNLKKQISKSRNQHIVDQRAKVKMQMVKAECRARGSQRLPWRPAGEAHFCCCCFKACND